MRITYEWTEREWTQAVGIATRKAAPGTPLPGMVYALVGIPLLGAIGDLISLAREPGRMTLAGSIVPLLLLMSAITAALIGGARKLQRRQRDDISPMPCGVREMVLQESGWRFNALLSHGSEALSDASPSSAPAVTTGPVPLPVTEGASPAAMVPPLRSWSELLEARRGSGMIVLVHRDGFEAVPFKSLTPEQAGHLHRLVMRKMRPIP